MNVAITIILTSPDCLYINSALSQWLTQEFCWGGSTNSVEDTGQKTGIWGQ